MREFPIELTVEARIDDRGDIMRLDLVAADGAPLPTFEAGAHVEIAVPAPDGSGVLARQYSLYGDPAETGRWRLGILLEPASRGGSRTLHAIAKPGARLAAATLRNHFPLVKADHTVLIGGGVGLTPMLAMAAKLASEGADFTLHVATRSADRDAFADVLDGFGDRVVRHHDDGVDGAPFDPETDLPTPGDGVRIYVCGPSGFMDWVIAAALAKGHADDHVHREYFHATVDASGTSFEVEARRSGVTVTVPEGVSIAAALASAGVQVPLSCEEGVCGTCLCDVLEGTPDHRDHFLTDDEKAAGELVLVCCSRSKSARLVLDL